MSSILNAVRFDCTEATTLASFLPEVFERPIGDDADRRVRRYRLRKETSNEHI